MSRMRIPWTVSHVLRFACVCLFCFLLGCTIEIPPVDPFSQSSEPLQGQKPSTGKAEVEATVNTAPVVALVQASRGQIQPGETILLNSSASDPDGDLLSYLWEDDCTGTFQQTTTAQVYWTAPQSAPAGDRCTLKLSVSDGKGGSHWGTLSLSVAGPLLANQAPRIVSFLQSESTIARSGAVTLRVQAVDPEGLPLTFVWKANKGTLSAPSSTSSHSEVSWQPPASDCDFSVRVTAKDPAGGSTQHKFDILVQCP